MPFMESSGSLQSKAHASDVPKPALIGLSAILVLLALLFAGNVSEGISIVTSFADEGQGSSSELEEVEGAEEQLALPEGNDSTSTSGTVGGGDVSMVYVYVSGEVGNPGVYSFPDGARVAEAVDAAGGFTGEASASSVNLARKLVDGEQVHVPAEGEEGGAAQPSIAAVSQDSALTLVNINIASAEELETLPGVGPSTAAKIVTSREQEGAFSSIEDLMRVSGIGDKKFQAIKDQICV